MAAAENSFDIACKLDMQEVSNAINQAKREIVLTSPDDMKLKAVLDILQSRLHRRGIDLKALTIGDPESAAGSTLRQRISLQDGVPQEKAKEIVRLIKDSKIRVQAAIQEKQVRVLALSMATTCRPSSPCSRPRTWGSRSSSPITAPLSRPLKRAQLRRWRPRPHAQRTESTPRV